MPTAKKKYEVVSVLICDDLRLEASGKEIIIGLYNDAIVFSAFPARLGKLVVRIVIRAFSDDLNSYQVRIVGTKSDTTLLDVSERLGQPMSIEDPNIMAFAFPAHFQGPETFDICFGLDGHLESIGKFSVRKPKDEKEKQRIPA